MFPSLCYNEAMQDKVLERLKHRSGSAVQRFGDWRKGEPQLIIDNQTWIEMGKPDKVTWQISPTKD